jgi:hypothetical protein
VDLEPYIAEDDILIDTQYDWQGNIWFVSSEGAVGYMDHENQTIHSILMPGEYIENGVAVAADGVFVLSSEACYRFEIDPVTRLPMYTWRIPYARGEVPKPGSFALGSGSTPTLLGEELITFTDNAEDQVNLLVYRRTEGYPGERLVCSVPLFEPGASAVDVSMIGYRNSIVVGNMYNAGSFLDDYRELAPGFMRVDVGEDRCGCDVVWETEIRSTSVPKLSTGTGLIYTYTQALEFEGPMDAWYFTAVDFETGRVVYRVLAGTGLYKANAFGGIAIGPDGTVYQGVAGGILALRDGS